MKKQATHLVQEVAETFAGCDGRQRTKKAGLSLASCMFPAVRSWWASFCPSPPNLSACSEKCLQQECSHTQMWKHTQAQRCNHAVCSAAKAKCPKSVRSLSNLKTNTGQFLSGIVRVCVCVCVRLVRLCVFFCVRVEPQSVYTQLGPQHLLACLCSQP